jgi:hypothetical protein
VVVVISALVVKIAHVETRKKLFGNAHSRFQVVTGFQVVKIQQCCPPLPCYLGTMCIPAVFVFTSAVGKASASGVDVPVGSAAIPMEKSQLKCSTPA